MSNASLSAADPRVLRVYVWEFPVRLTHWLITLSIIVLAVTGFYIGNPFIVVPDPAGQHFVMATMKAIHFYAAIVFSLSEIARIIWMFVGNRYARWNQLVPTRKERWKDLLEWLKFYIFVRPNTPRFVGHNPLAGLSYAVVYLVCIVSALTGYALFAIEAGPDSPVWPFASLLPLFGGAQTARWIHHVAMWLIIGFVVHHIACAVLVARVAQNATIDSMFSGFRFVSPEDLAAVEEQESER
jgi:Ni/Fe-hydrogenase 1 B-type cytochrome subunit